MKAEITLDTDEKLKDFIIKCLEDKKAENISVIDLGEASSLARYFIIASGKSSKNVSSMADFVSIEVRNNSNLNVGIEGLRDAQWVLVDCGDVIVHIFHPEAREIFRLEDLWKKRINSRDNT